MSQRSRFPALRNLTLLTLALLLLAGTAQARPPGGGGGGGNPPPPLIPVKIILLCGSTNAQGYTPHSGPDGLATYAPELIAPNRTSSSFVGPNSIRRMEFGGNCSPDWPREQRC